MGYPGAGKTTISKVIHELTGAKHLSSDNTRFQLFKNPSFSPEEHEALYKALDAQTEKLLSEGKDVIYDANLNRLQHRHEKYDICQRTGASSVLVWVKTPLELAKQRAVTEHRLHLVPRDETLASMFERIAGIIEEPAGDEPYVEIDGSNVSKQMVADSLNL